MTKPVLCPLDGRYASRLTELFACMADSALASARVRVECTYFERLCSLKLPGLPALSASEKKFLNNLPNLSDSDLQIISDYEFKGRNGIPATNHDVKAVEYFLKEKFAASSLKNRAEWIHFALTSEDVNSVAYAMLLSDATEKVLLPALLKIQHELTTLARKEASSVLLARTHGQPAVPTTFGKEMRVYAERLKRQTEQLKTRTVTCKFGGAVGNYNAQEAAFPRTDWRKNARALIAALNKGRKLKLVLTEVSTQVDPRDSYAELFDNLRRANVILLDFCRDMWAYIAAGLVAQKAAAGEVGSSTMPQKINPIDFENAEGNLGLSNALLTFFSEKLPISRLQRDLSDSTVLRNMGTAFGYALTAYQSVLKGLSRAALNRAAARAELLNHPEVLAEGIQVILRAAGADRPYERLKDFTRGRAVTADLLRAFIENLPVDDGTKKRLLALDVLTYIGLAECLAKGE